LDKDERNKIEREMICKLLVELLRLREGDAVVTPCGLGETLLDGLQIYDLGPDDIRYQLYYNVGRDTKTVTLQTERTGEV